RRGLSAYIPRRLRAGRTVEEYRNAAILFLEVEKLPLRACLATLQPLIVTVLDAMEAHEGVLLKNDLSADGTKLLCVFGVPRAQEDALDRAARSGLEILERAPASARVRGAIHGGVVACLELGTAARRSIDVMGDVVNTAARVLSLAAWGEVLITSAA